jgi:cation diffusion facilitator family transporter
MTDINQSNIDRKKLVYQQGWVSIFANGMLFVSKYWVGVVSGSIALMADAWHSLSDSLTSVIVIFGAKISNKPPDKEHPFGHGRAELIASIIIGVILGFVGFEFAKESISKLVNKEGVQYGIAAIWVIAASILVNELLAQYAFWIGRKTGNPSLRADGWHHRSDALSSVIILVGIFFAKHFWWIDGVLGFIVSMLLFYAAYDIIKDGTNPLLGETPEEDLLSELKKIANDASGMETHLHHVHMHRYGEHMELTMHIKLPRETTLKNAHQIADDIEMEIARKLSMEATIHMEPL